MVRRRRHREPSPPTPELKETTLAQAGGNDPHKNPPTIAELEAILAREDDPPIEIMPNGSIRVL